jgi:hypothetical protein
MGFFSIRGEEIVDIHKQVWFPNMDSASERTRVLNQPGIDSRLKTVRQTTDAEATIFEVNKTIKGPYGKVPSSRPGIVARTGETSFEVHIPVHLRAFDIGSIATTEVQFDPKFAETYEQGRDANLGQLAVARAIRAHINNPKSSIN